MSITQQRHITLRLERMAIKYVQSIRQAYHRNVLKPILTRLRESKSFDGMKYRLGLSLFHDMKESVLTDALSLCLTQAAGIGMTAAIPPGSTLGEDDIDIVVAKDTWRLGTNEMMLVNSVKLIAEDDFTPKPAIDVQRFFDKKTPLTSDQFDLLSDINKSRAFRIANVNKASLIQSLRDKISTAIRNGSSWSTVRDSLIQEFSDQQVKVPAINRLLTVFRMNAYHAQNVARKTILDDPDVVDSFPYRQYITVGNGQPGFANVRDSHAKLHNKIFYHDDPFWDKFTPPWDYNCRCMFIALTKSMVKAQGGRVWTWSNGYLRVLQGDREKQVPVAPKKEFGFPRNAFDKKDFNLKKLDEDLKKVLEDIIDG